MFVNFCSLCLLLWDRHFEFHADHVTLSSVATPWRPHGDPIRIPTSLGSLKYGYSVQYDLGLLHAPLWNGPPIALTLLSRIHHEIKRDYNLTIIYNNTDSATHQWYMYHRGDSNKYGPIAAV